MCLTSCLIFYSLNVIISVHFQKKFPSKNSNFSYFFIFSPILLQTLDLDNFVEFYWVLLKLGMLIPLDAFYFFFLPSMLLQLSKAKQLLGENVYILFKFRVKYAIFPLFQGVLKKNFTLERVIIKCKQFIIINLNIAKKKLALTVTIIQKKFKNL